MIKNEENIECENAASISVVQPSKDRDLTLYDNISSNGNANVSSNGNASIYGNASALSGTERSHVVDGAFSTDTSRNPETGSIPSIDEKKMFRRGGSPN